MTIGYEHGKSFISVDGDIITVKAVGAYNTEGIVKVIEELKVIIESFSHKEFKLLCKTTLCGSCIVRFWHNG